MLLCMGSRCLLSPCSLMYVTHTPPGAPCVYAQHHAVKFPPLPMLSTFPWKSWLLSLMESPPILSFFLHTGNYFTPATNAVTLLTLKCHPTTTKSLGKLKMSFSHEMSQKNFRKVLRSSVSVRTFKKIF